MSDQLTNCLARTLPLLLPFALFLLLSFVAILPFSRLPFAFSVAFAFAFDLRLPV